MKNLGTKRLETERLILRRINETDYKEAYKNWCSSLEVSKYVLWEVHENEKVTQELYHNWIEEYNDLNTYRWIIELKETNEVVGTIDISKKFLSYGTGEMGYCLEEKYWNKGIMTEAAKKVIKYLFEECEFDTIWAQFLANNPNSGKVMEKVGMKYEGRLRSRIVDKNGIRNDLIVYSILKDDYIKDKYKEGNENGKSKCK